ncbi:MAG: T9SS type A sorting domain-containing protein [Fidelibacterota bacterium]
MNTKLTGDDPLNFNHWCFVEPQNDTTNVQPGGWNIPYNTIVGIRALDGFNTVGGPTVVPIIYFSLDDEGNPSLYYQNPDLILERPEISVAQENPEIPSQYVLEQNYPNPFNPKTTITYNLPKREKVSLDIYDIKGRKLETLVNGVLDQGQHKALFDASKYSSGVYLYRIQTESGYSKAKKMVVEK